MIRCDQKQCEHHSPGADNKGYCIAQSIELAEAPGGFWLSCRTRTNGKQWKPKKEKGPKHVCGKQGFGVGAEGLWDICWACELDKKARGF